MKKRDFLERDRKKSVGAKGNNIKTEEESENRLTK